MTEHHELRELLGAYVLDQLDPSLTTEVEAHLVGCRACRSEAAALGPVVLALRDVDPALMASVQPPADLGDRVLGRVREHDLRRRRRHRLQRVGGALAVAASVAVAFGTGAWFAGPRDDPPVVDVAAVQTAPGVRAQAGLVRHTWGTELKLDASGLSEGASYAVTFVGDDGSRVDAGSFLGTGARPVRCSVNAALSLDHAVEVAVTDRSGAVVIDAEVR